MTLPRWMVRFAVGGLLAISGGISLAQAPAPVGGVFTCIDAQGRKQTADRPIPECNDREQQVLNPSGTVKAKIGPSLTAREKAELELKEKRETEERAVLAEARRRDRALLNRYPSRAVHDKERAEALAQIDVVIKAANNRSKELAAQRKSIEEEMEFYKKDPSKAPAYVRRQLEENTHSQTVQKQFLIDQETEIRRVNVRFDDELVRLRQLWTAPEPRPSR